jgi:hypothetical protein
VNYFILLNKLNVYGIQGKAEQWFNHILMVGKQVVEIKSPN